MKFSFFLVKTNSSTLALKYLVFYFFPGIKSLVTPSLLYKLYFSLLAGSAYSNQVHHKWILCEFQLCYFLTVTWSNIESICASIPSVVNETKIALIS